MHKLKVKKMSALQFSLDLVAVYCVQGKLHVDSTNTLLNINILLLTQLFMHRSKSHSIHYLNDFADAYAEILCMLLTTFYGKRIKNCHRSEVFSINISLVIILGLVIKLKTKLQNLINALPDNNSNINDDNNKQFRRCKPKP